MKWITRERPKIDRIACPWLIVNFILKSSFDGMQSGRESGRLWFSRH
jgi:hypothetical protein